VIYTPHGFGFYQYKGIRRYLFYWLERFASSLTDKIIYVSESEKRSAVSIEVAPEDKIAVINNGIDADIFRNNPAGKLRNLIGLKQESIVISMVARLSRPKNPEDLVHALDILVKEQSLTNISVVFIGGGPLEESTRKLVDVLDLDDHVYFIGDRDDVPDLLPDVDIFVLTSSSEGMPYTILEAMAAGKPVVGTRVKGIVDLVIDGVNGFTYAEGHIQELAIALLTLCRDEELREEFGKSGQRRVEDEFTVDRMVEETQTQYLALLNAKLRTHK
jgi:glycosyltransferase involved in cell wall biosynthesis